MIFTTGKGPMFKESMSSESDLESESKSLESIIPIGTMSELVNPSDQGKSLLSDELVNTIISNFENINSFTYELCTISTSSCPFPSNCNDEFEKEIFKEVEEHKNKTPIIKETEKINLSNDNDQRR